MTKLKQHSLDKIRSDVAELASSLKEGGSYHAVSFQHLLDRLQNAKNLTEAEEIFQYMPYYNLDQALSLTNNDTTIVSNTYEQIAEFERTIFSRNPYKKDPGEILEKLKSTLAQLIESLKNQEKPHKMFENALNQLNRTKDPKQQLHILRNKIPRSFFYVEAKFTWEQTCLIGDIWKNIVLIRGVKPKGPLEAADIKVPESILREVTTKLEKFRDSLQSQGRRQARIFQSILERIELAETDAELQSALDDFPPVTFLDSCPLDRDDTQLFDEIAEMIVSLEESEKT